MYWILQALWIQPADMRSTLDEYEAQEGALMLQGRAEGPAHNPSLTNLLSLEISEALGIVMNQKSLITMRARKA